MSRHTEATPCPAISSTFKSFRPRDSLISIGSEDTANIDFTTEFRASIRDAGPRRPKKGFGGRRATLGFDIHEDEVLQLPPNEVNQRHADPPVQPRPTAERSFRASSILAQPAQRFRPRVSFAITNRADGYVSMDALAASKPQVEVPAQASPSPKMEKIKKPARRGTIYIPPEDTTVPSIYMGVFSPIKSQIDQAGSENANELTGIAAQMARKRGPRKSLASAPKRAPLQQPLRAIQETASAVDIPGRNSGKENIPPGLTKDGERKDPLDKLLDLSKPKPRVGTKLRSDPVRAARKSIAFEPGPTWSKPADAPIVASNGISPKQGTTAKNDLISKAPAKVARPLKPRMSTICKDSPKAIEKPRPERIPSKVTIPCVPQAPLSAQYPLLSEDISNPSMYEEDWLAHQEIAIAQLVNNLFASAHSTPNPYETSSLRFRLLEIYQEDCFSLLYKRLQASLLYGALSVPKELLAKGNRLKDDLGLKRKFLDMWTETYDLHVLKAGAEVVVGRELIGTPRNSSNSAGGQYSPRLKASKRNIDKFLETFLIRNEDTMPESSKELGNANCYRRTILRSLLLVLLLDKAKISSNSPISGCLFASTSPFKSSAALLQALAAMLIPAVGDITRPLGHFDYTVKHVQYPLEEYEYRIENLAVDLRDGVRLTRIVELLLYPSASLLLDRARDGGATTTLAMPTGEVLSLLDGEQDWPLSQHLKFPCIGRATKLFNVQVALSALSGVKGIGVLAESVTAEDIVDGFREKSLALLWGLVEKWGLGSLVDWDDVKSEIGRMRKKAGQIGDGNGDESDDETTTLTPQDYRHLLEDWASAIASARGLTISNLTTSFADGKVFEAIVDEYEPFMNSKKLRSSGGDSLTPKLSALGCSVQFATLFTSSTSTPHAGRIFDRDFTLAALAFLCSRLLSGSKQSRAATKIQRAWRRSLQRIDERKRNVCRKLALECMTVVKTRERLLWAKNTIWQCWKQHRTKSGMCGSRTGRDLVSEAVDDHTSDIWLSL